MITVPGGHPVRERLRGFNPDMLEIAVQSRETVSPPASTHGRECSISRIDRRAS